MGQCIICGTSTDGKICASHEEDVVFEFRGTKPEQLTSGRFYRGTVDGYADFGVFVDLNQHVTGLLHRSKLDRRLESLDWEVGDEVFVQVTNVRDNGDVDLGWSIRQSDREFRGTLVDDPEGEYEPESESEPEPETDDADAAQSGSTGEDEHSPAETEQPAPETETGAGRSTEGSDTESAGGAAETDEREAAADTASGGAESASESEPETEPEQTSVEELSERVGDVVRVEGEVVSVRQTSGPTVFELRDETGAVDCAAFVEAGVRAYPEVETGDVVRIDGEVRTRRDELQVETEALVVLEGEERAAVEERMEDALDARARPESVELLADDDALDADSIESVATRVRRALLESRPVVVRHPATADGYVAGAAIERAALPIIEGEHAASDATYHYFDRRPLEGNVYDMDDATGDVTDMLDDQERHDEKFPLFVFAGAGTTRDSADGLGLLDVYGARRVVVAGDAIEEAVERETEAALSADGERTAATLAANVAAAVNDDVREDLHHLPAVSYWEEAPERYVELAEEAGYDEETTRQLREAVALEAYYQSYEDKRELIVDLLFDEHEEGDGRGLARQVSEQFRTKLDAELDTAEANLDTREVGDTTVAVLDTDAYTHRFDFPPADLLLDALHRRTREEAPVLVGVADDEVRVRSTDGVDVRAVADRVRDRVPEAGVHTHGEQLEFLVGERDAVVDAVVEAVAGEGEPAEA